MKKSEVIWLDRGWQPAEIGFCPDEEAWNNWIKEFSEACSEEVDAAYPLSDASTNTFENYVNGKTYIIVCLNNEENHTPIEIIGLLNHEASHVLDEVILNMKEKEPGSEFKAYAFQAITMELLQAFKETRKDLFK